MHATNTACINVCVCVHLCLHVGEEDRVGEGCLCLLGPVGLFHLNFLVGLQCVLREMVHMYRTLENLHGRLPAELGTFGIFYLFH